MWTARQPTVPEHDRGVLAPSTPFTFPQIVSRILVSFSVVNIHAISVAGSTPRSRATSQASWVDGSFELRTAAFKSATPYAPKHLAVVMLSPSVAGEAELSLRARDWSGPP